jgi:L-ribulokinase
MAKLSEARFVPQREHRDAYDLLYGEYRRLHDLFGRGGDDVMRRLKSLRKAVAAAASAQP